MRTKNAKNAATGIEEKSIFPLQKTLQKMTRPFSLNTDKNSPYWLVSFIGADGKQKRRSTKVPINGGNWKEQKLTKRGARKVAELEALEIVKEESRKEKSGESVRGVFDTVLAHKKQRVTTKTFKNMQKAARNFLAFIGTGADRPVSCVTKGQIVNFVNARRGDVRKGTAVVELGFLKQAFQYAEDAELLTRNPARGLTVPADSPWEKTQKEAFTLAEMQTLLNGLPDEWAAAVRCSFECYGLRLSDTLRLRYEQIDWEHRLVNVRTGKTARFMKQPMRESFYNWAQARWEKAKESGDEYSKEYICGSLFRLENPSLEFGKHLATLGIGETLGSTVGRRRARRTKTFHCIRATCATMLHLSGVSQTIAMELVGHNSAEVHQAYVRPRDEELRSCAEKMPEL